MPVPGLLAVTVIPGGYLKREEHLAFNQDCPGTQSGPPTKHAGMDQWLISCLPSSTGGIVPRYLLHQMPTWRNAYAPGSDPGERKLTESSSLSVGTIRRSFLTE